MPGNVEHGWRVAWMLFALHADRFGQRIGTVESRVVACCTADVLIDRPAGIEEQCFTECHALRRKRMLRVAEVRGQLLEQRAGLLQQNRILIPMFALRQRSKRCEATRS